MLGHNALSELPLSTQAAGAASGDVTVSGVTLSVTVALVDGAVSGTASVSGATQTVTPVLVDGTVSIASDVTVSGETQSVSPVLVDGTATGNADVAGQTISVTPALVDGVASGSAQVTGGTITATPSLLDGSVAISVSVSGEIQTATPVLIDGVATVPDDETVTGEVLTVAPTVVAGSVTVTAEDDGGHWHYAKLQRQRRAKARAERRAEIQPVAVETPPVVVAVRSKLQPDSLRSVAVVSVKPITRVSFVSDVNVALSSQITTRVLPIVRFSATNTNVESLSVDIRARTVNVLQEIRDLEDMIDLYELLMVA